MKEIVIRIQVLDDGQITTPSVDYVDDTPPEPEWVAPLPLPTAPPLPAAPPPMPVTNADPIPQCPQHGAMTFHAAKTKPDGKQISARYSCDVKVNGAFCPTPAKWLSKAA